MNVTINGKLRDVPEETTVAELLSRFSLADERVAVEHNERILSAEEFDKVQVVDGDTLEVVRFVGGG